MPTTPDCLYGRIMKFLTFFLLLPETIKRTRKTGKQLGKLPVCYEIVTLSLRKKMAAELYPASINTNLPNSNETAVTAASKKNIAEVTQTVTTPTATATQQNINNNNVETASWQSTHPTLRERNALMFNNELMADVHFVVGPPGESQKVPAHKYVLAVGSSVFGAMFYGDLAEGESEIHIPDVEPAAFLILLNILISMPHSQVNQGVDGGSPDQDPVMANPISRPETH
ncbi:BTB/POZ domain-containing protein 6-B-like isoform X4 [Xyrauchen texanus]|uniref:BTB/POZ domain-containing protein 6-B-like isoform X4 n=1 Tax=Xyrauchen texanus TaxID=154827 RepID=UPI002241D07E|nr:BTB/POZ domain-containing protein 6-B-like isoform X4 [Xyrauchen texanus]